MVINKIDRQDSRPDEVLDEIYGLLIDLNATDDQLEFPLLYAAGRDGIAQKTPEEKGKNLHVLLDTIVEEIPGPSSDTGCGDDSAAGARPGAGSASVAGSGAAS